MVGGRFSSKLNTNYLVISLAMALVLYHLGQYVYGPSALLNQLLPQSTPVVQHQPSPTPTGQAVVATNYLIGEQVDPSKWPTHISTTGIDLDVEGSIEKNGAWNISLTKADFAINTAIPNTKAGNTTIFGHDRPGLFHPIHNLNIGDQVTVTAPDGIYIYNVTGNTVVDPTDISIFNQTPTPTLTMITCNGWFSDKRYVVFAKLASFTATSSVH